MPLTPEEVRLIESRQRAAGWTQPARVRQILHRHTHGLGATADQPIDLLAAMKTNVQARAVLGVDAKYLQKGYEAAERIPDSKITAMISIPELVKYFGGGRNARVSAKSLLDATNAYAQKVYAKIPNDMAPVSAQIRKEVTLVTKQTLENVKLVEDTEKTLSQGLLRDLLDVLHKKVQDLAQGMLDKFLDHKVKLDIPKAVIWGAVAVGGLLGLYLAVKVVHGVMLRGAALEEAETAAVALAEASARKKRERVKPKAVLTIA